MGAGYAHFGASLGLSLVALRDKGFFYWTTCGYAVKNVRIKEFLISMRQSLKSRIWQGSPLLTAGGRNEAQALARSAQAEELKAVREIRPSGEYVPRPGS